MITVEFNPNKYRLKVSGHACSAEEGHDLVCASVSILFYTLAMAIDASEGICRKDSIKKKVLKGASSIECKPLADYEAVIQRTFWSILFGFEALAKDYPEYVCFKVVG